MPQGEPVAAGVKGVCECPVDAGSGTFVLVGGRDGSVFFVDGIRSWYRALETRRPATNMSSRVLRGNRGAAVSEGYSYLKFCTARHTWGGKQSTLNIPSPYFLCCVP